MLVNESQVTSVTLLPLPATEANEKSSTITEFNGQATTLFNIIKNPPTADYYLWQNLIPNKNITGLIASSDTGKSMVAQQLSIAIALKKKEFLGLKLNITHNKVVYVSTEDSDLDWHLKVGKQQFSAEEVENLKNLTIIQGYDKDFVKLMGNFLKHHKIDLLVIDVITDAFQGDPNSSTQVRRFMNELMDLAREHEFTILYLHHIKKASDNSLGNKTDVLGSSAFESKVRSLMFLRKNSSNNAIRTLSIVKANGLSIEQKQIEYNIRINPDLTLSLDSKNEATTTKATKSNNPEIRDAIVEMLNNNPSISGNKIAKELKARNLDIERTAAQKLTTAIRIELGLGTRSKKGSSKIADQNVENSAEIYFSKTMTQGSDSRRFKEIKQTPVIAFVDRFKHLPLSASNN